MLVRHGGARLRFPLLCLAISCGSCFAQAQEQRLSDWLLQRSPSAEDYPLGLSWRVPAEVPAQHTLLLDLLASLAGGEQVAAEPQARAKLRDWLRGLAPTGRVTVSTADARWLQANPVRDPVLGSGHSVVVPRRPITVTVLMGDGRHCQVPHAQSLEARDYARACGVQNADWAWVAQPDGRVHRYGVALWNEHKQDDPAPGAWIWAPARGTGWPEDFSEKLIAFLATQGPAADGLPGARDADRPAARLPATPGGASPPFSLSGQPSLAGLRPELVSAATPTGLRAPSSRSRDFMQTANDWGATGLMQTPSARLGEEGHFAVRIGRIYPNVGLNVVVSPFDWMEVGLRYTNITNRLYGPQSFSGSQAYKDKGFDARFRVWKESAYFPQVAVGIQDLSGTGLFAGEYVVGSKRTGPFDWSLGLGWGYVGARGDIRNPLSRLNSSFDTRSGQVGQGGNFLLSSYFRGPTALFGGVQYQTPWENLVLKAEYDGNDYQNEPLGNNVPQRSPFNFGLVYRYSRSVDLTAGIERGNTIMLGLVLRTQLDGLSMPKVSDPAPIAVSQERPKGSPDWAFTSRDLTARTGWRVQRIEQKGRELHVVIDDAGGFHWRDRIDRVAAVLHRDAPASADRFVISYNRNGVLDTQHVIERDAWAAPINQPLPPSAYREAVTVRAAREDGSAGLRLYDNPRPRFESGFGVGYQQVLGGPDHFYLYQLSATHTSTFRFREDTWLRGLLSYGLLDNYDRYNFAGSSDLPRVRTFQREYFTSPGLKVANLQLTNVGRLSENQYYSVYGGYLEFMFAGVGAEWMYRPRSSSVAFGVDVNQVQQRDFRQNFELRDYKVGTGHATMYWDTGWKNVLATVSVGRYLAGDIGGTLELAKQFPNGVTIGAFATKTNVSAAQFGEGSFDKGIFIAIPFDVMLTRSSNSIAAFLYRPVSRDGGQRLFRSVTLYDQTRLRGERNFELRPAPQPNEARIPVDRVERTQIRQTANQPFTRVIPRTSTDVPGPELVASLEAELYRQGFRNIEVKLEATKSLNLRVSHMRLRPVSRAVGRAARAAAAMAPIDTRDIRVVVIEDGHPAATYDFVDFSRLQEFFAGQLSRAEFSRYVRVQHHDSRVAESDPLARFDDLSSDVDEREFRPLQPIIRRADTVLDDFREAGRTAVGIDWLGAGAAGIGLVAVSALVDKRGDQFARERKDVTRSQGITRIGDAIPWMAMAGAGAAALIAPDPVLSRTGYAATEAGGSAFLAATALKYIVGRSRPDSGESYRKFESFSKGSGDSSFPSRHTAVAWATITPFVLQYDAPWLYGLAAITQVGRIASREHWFSDTVAGALVGTAIGQVFHQASKTPRDTGPRFGVGPRGVSVAWEFN